MKRKSAKDKEFENNGRLLCAWRAWHAEELVEALAGVHRDVLGRLMAQLKALRSARELVDAVAAEDWSVVDADTRLIALHEINQTITKLREKSGMEPISDPLPGQADNNALRIIKTMFEKFPAPGRTAGVAGKSVE